MLVSGLGPGAVSNDSKTPSGDPYVSSSHLLSQKEGKADVYIFLLFCDIRAHVLLKALCTSDAGLADILEQITTAPLETPSLFASDFTQVQFIAMILLHPTIADVIARYFLQSWTEDAMTVMDDRLRSILSSSSPSPYETTESREPDEPMVGVETITTKESHSGPALGLELPKGWSLMDEKRWRACPIGVFVSYE